MIQKAVDAIRGMAQIVWLVIAAVAGIGILWVAGRVFLPEPDLVLPEPVEESVSPPAPSEPVEVVNEGGWIVTTESDPIDDSPTVIAMAAEEDGTPLRTAMLIARCMRNRTETWIAWDDYLGSDSRSEVTYRFPPAAARSSSWSGSVDDRATFSPRPMPLLREISENDGSQMVARTTPYNSGPVTVTFDLTGARDAIAQVAEACGWSVDDG